MSNQISKLLAAYKGTVVTSRNIAYGVGDIVPLCAVNPLRIYLWINVHTNSSEVQITPDSSLAVVPMKIPIGSSAIGDKEFWVDRHYILSQTGWTLQDLLNLGEVNVLELVLKE